MDNDHFKKSLEEALLYFARLERNSPILERTEEAIKYTEYIGLVNLALNRLNKYSRDELEFLRDRGFRIPESLINRSGQDKLEIVFEFASKRGVYCTRPDDIEQIMLVTKTYMELLNYEQQVPELRRLMAVEEALRRIGQ